MAESKLSAKQIEELTGKLKDANDAQEIVAVVGGYGIELDASQVEEALSRPSEVSDEELAAVAGGYDWDARIKELGKQAQELFSSDVDQDTALAIFRAMQSLR